MPSSLRAKLHQNVLGRATPVLNTPHHHHTVYSVGTWHDLLLWRQPTCTVYHLSYFCITWNLFLAIIYKKKNRLLLKKEQWLRWHVIKYANTMCFIVFVYYINISCITKFFTKMFETFYIQIGSWALALWFRIYISYSQNMTTRFYRTF